MGSVRPWRAATPSPRSSSSRTTSSTRGADRAAPARRAPLVAGAGRPVAVLGLAFTGQQADRRAGAGGRRPDRGAARAPSPGSARASTCSGRRTPRRAARLGDLRGGRRAARHHRRPGRLPQYTALDVDTGTHPWSTTLRGPGPGADRPAEQHDDVLPALGGRPRRLPGHRRVRAAPRTTAPTTADLPPRRTSSSSTWPTGASWPTTPSPPASSLAVRPGLVATAVVDDQRHLVVVATDPMTGDELWRFRDPEPVRGLVDQYTAGIASAGDLVVLFNRPSGPLVLDASGQVVEPERTTDSWRVHRRGLAHLVAPEPRRPRTHACGCMRPGQAAARRLRRPADPVRRRRQRARPRGLVGPADVRLGLPDGQAALAGRRLGGQGLADLDDDPRGPRLPDHHDGRRRAGRPRRLRPVEDAAAERDRSPATC